jgi:hypothetical protein
VPLIIVIEPSITQLFPGILADAVIATPGCAIRA